MIGLELAQVSKLGTSTRSVLKGTHVNSLSVWPYPKGREGCCELFQECYVERCAEC